MTSTDGLILKIVHATPEVEGILSSRSKEPEMPINSLPMLSRKIWGIHRRKLYVVGARTGIGKSAFTLQCAWDIAKLGKKVLFLSLESTISETIERLFCNIYSIDSFDLICGKFDNYKSKWVEFLEVLKDKKFLISDSIGRTMGEIQEILEKMKETPDLLVIDYVQMIKNISRQKNEDIAEFVKFLRTLAVRNNMAVWLVSQVNRDGEGEMPTLAQLKGSGVLEEHPDVVFLLHATHQETGDIKNYYFFVAKNRNGRIGKIDIHYEGKFYRFHDNHIEVAEKSEKVKQIEAKFDGTAYERFKNEEE